ncbi:diphthine--ammonia ligase [Haloimpatiens sp. FM7330]|uniref:Dph6-related ATP pyrophosphatase n=1 Tax=Haloimpatiens sp. FM7330 TaxID=3298610 RepID=UPI00363824FE
MKIKDQSFVCSWSGGKDSCLSLYRAIKQGGKPKYLLTMLTENGDRSRSHGLKIELIKRQSKALGIPILFGQASWKDYEQVFIENLKALKSKGCTLGVFGDIDIDDHKKWEEDSCNSANISAYLPLWQEPRKKLVEEFIDSGFKAIIVTIKEGALDKKFLGRTLNHDLIREMEDLGVDPCGESGEFHTVVIDGPIFELPVKVHIKGCIYHEGYWFLDMNIND